MTARAAAATISGHGTGRRVPIGANYAKDLGRPLPRAYQRHYEFLNQFKSAERIAQRYGIGRDRADEFGYLSQQRAAAAWAQGRFGGQVVTGCLAGHGARSASFLRRARMSAWTTSGGWAPSTVNIHSRPA